MDATPLMIQTAVSIDFCEVTYRCNSKTLSQVFIPAVFVGGGGQGVYPYHEMADSPYEVQ